MKNINQEIYQLYKGVHSLIDDEIINRSNNGSNSHKDIVPMFYKDFKNPSEKILFVGINPSLTQEMINGFKRIHGDTDLLFFSKLTNEQFPSRIKQLIHFQEILKGRVHCKQVKRIAYFSAIHNLLNEAADSIQIAWEHYDLFSYRNTSQYSMTRLLGVRNRKRNPHIKNYFRQSIDRLKRLVDDQKFKLIIIANAQVSKWIKEEKPFTPSDLEKYKIVFSKQIIGGLSSDERKDLIKIIQKNFGLLK